MALAVVFAVSLLLALKSAAHAAEESPRFAHCRFCRAKMVIIALPNVAWRDLREANAPNLHWLIEHGAIGLMPIAGPMDKDPNRTWASLGAIEGAAGGPAQTTVERLRDGQLQTDIGAVRRANRMADTDAEVGFLGAQLREHGLRTAVLGAPDRGVVPGALALMDEDGQVGDAASGLARPFVGVARYRSALPEALLNYDIVLVDLSALAEHGRPLPVGPRVHGVAPRVALPAVRLVESADPIVGQALREVRKYDGYLALVTPQMPWYPDPVTEKSLGPVILYEAKSPQQGLLYTPRTRWPGVVTAGDITPTLLGWWQIDESRAYREREAHVRPLEVKPGAPADLDRLDRTISQHYRWGFRAITLNMEYVGALIGLALLGTIWWRRLLPGLRTAALAAPLIPIGLLLAHLTHVHNEAAFLVIGFALTGALALAASSFQPPALALAAAGLLGSAVLVVDTLTGAWLTRTAAYTFPLISGSRFYGLGNEYMGVLLGLSAVGLGALWEVLPRGKASDAVIFLVSAALVVIVGAPVWGTNWGGSFSIAVALVTLWALAAPRSWKEVVPSAIFLLLVSALLPPLIEVAFGPTRASHIGLTALSLLSGHPGAVAATLARKLRLSLWILTYTPWTSVLALGFAGATWVLFRKGAPARAAVGDQRRLGAGIWGAIVGGVVAMLVNDSGVAAGAGAFCAALGAVIFMASAGVHRRDAEDAERAQREDIRKAEARTQ